MQSSLDFVGMLEFGFDCINQFQLNWRRCVKGNQPSFDVIRLSNLHQTVFGSTLMVLWGLGFLFDDLLFYWLDFALRLGSVLKVVLNRAHYFTIQGAVIFPRALFESAAYAFTGKAERKVWFTHVRRHNIIVTSLCQG